jgi:urease accessory protein
LTVTAGAKSGHLSLRFALRATGTILSRQDFSWPYTVGRRFYLDGDAQTVTVIVQSVSSTINAGDFLTQSVHVEPFARARMRGQGAVSVHTAKGDIHSAEDVALVVERGGYLEFLPECRILFPASVFEQDLQIDVAPGGAAIVVDGFVVGRGIDGVFTSYASTLHITSDGTALARETVRLAGSVFQASSLPDHTAHGLVILAMPGMDESADFNVDLFSDPVAMSPDLYMAVFPLPNGAGLAGRIAATDGRMLRQGIAICVEEFRRVARGAQRPVPSGV